MRIGRDSEKFVVRFPEGLRDRLKVVANGNRRSMNAEIVYQLERGLFDPLALPSSKEPAECEAR